MNNTNAIRIPQAIPAIDLDPDYHACAKTILLRWTGSNLWTAIAATVVWGACGWGTVVPLQPNTWRR